MIGAIVMGLWSGDALAFDALEEGPWHVIGGADGTTALGRVAATDPGATNDWFEYAERRQAWRWLGPSETQLTTKKWTVTVGATNDALRCNTTVDGVVYQKCQKVKSTFVTGSSPVKPVAPFVTVPAATDTETVAAYHQAGNYTITAGSAQAKYYIHADGALRHELVCGPSTFPWPARDDAGNPNDAAVTWVIDGYTSQTTPNPMGSTLDQKLTCPSGTSQRARHTVNLTPP